jgi:hypothetical protein
MPDPRNAEHQRRWRERQAGRLPPVKRPCCTTCGKVHRGAHGALCASCWERITPEGKAAHSERVRRAQRRKRDRL